MIDFKEKILDNGLHVIHHKHKSPVALCNVLYKVGSKDESENQTGFAHFFEHLMFSGTKQVPDFDERINELGAGNNAFTSTDLTNYYIEIPNQNLEYALFLEADRMRDLNISEKDINEFKKFIDKEEQRINKSGIDRFDFENLYTFPGEKTDFNFYKSVADSLFDLRDEEINNAFWQSYGKWSTTTDWRRIIIVFQNGKK